MPGDEGQGEKPQSPKVFLGKTSVQIPRGVAGVSGQLSFDRSLTFVFFHSAHLGLKDEKRAHMCLQETFRDHTVDHLCALGAYLVRLWKKSRRGSKSRR